MQDGDTSFPPWRELQLPFCVSAASMASGSVSQLRSGAGLINSLWPPVPVCLASFPPDASPWSGADSCFPPSIHRIHFCSPWWLLAILTCSNIAPVRETPAPLEPPPPSFASRDYQLQRTPQSASPAPAPSPPSRDLPAPQS